ncbi:hypothetical protein [Pseudomonas sp. NA-150]|uniref:hypothetical protein n=1 Tax=Pseudomonas sp. NA-150 TaxID=3367525 RepID=UPI0037C9CC88
MTQSIPGKIIIPPYTSGLIDETRLKLIAQLVPQLAAASALLACLDVMQWQLRNLSFFPLQHLFQDMTITATRYVDQLDACIAFSNQGAPFECSRTKDRPPKTSEIPDGFKACLIEIYACTETIALAPQRFKVFIDRASEHNDYATREMLTGLLSHSRNINKLIESNIPRESSLQRVDYS